MKNDRLNIAVIGAGGVGGYLAAKLIRSDLADITLFARGKQLEAIQENGLMIIDVDKRFTVKPHCVAQSDDLFDVVFIATKSYDFESACTLISKNINANTLIIPLSNGVNHKEVLQKYLPYGVIGEGCVYIVSHVLDDGTIYKKSPLFYLQFGCDTADDKIPLLLLSILNQSGLKTKYSDKIGYDCWKKYLFIAPFATMTSYFQESMDSVMQNHHSVVIEVLAEAKEVANALEVPISDEDVAKVIKQAQNLPKDSKTSMQLDFEEGKKTELESLTGYVVKEAKKRGILVKNFEKMYQALLQR